MTRFWRTDAGTVVLYFFAVVIISAVLLPWIYRGGVWLGGLAETGELIRPLEWLGEKAQRAIDRGRIGRFFSRALAFSALLLMPLLFWRLRHTRSARKEAGLGLVPLRPARRKLLHFAFGFAVSAGILWLVASLLAFAGAFDARTDFAANRLLGQAVVPALGAAAIEEGLFRGLILGVWLRAQSARAAVVGTSVLFAVLHFLSPLPSDRLADPAAVGAGFELLGKILGRFSEPQFFFAELVTLFVLGMMLAWSRVKTAALWLPLGLHAGIVFAFKAFNMTHERSDGGTVSGWWIGEDLRAGLVPLASLLLMAAVTVGFLAWEQSRQPSR